MISVWVKPMNFNSSIIILSVLFAISGCATSEMDFRNDAVVSEPFMSAEIQKPVKVDGSGNAMPDEQVEEVEEAEVAEEVTENEELTTESAVILHVKPGMLHQNLIRMSSAHGWQPPLWKSKRQIMTYGAYEIEAPTFEEAVQKFLSNYEGIQATISRLDKVILVN